MLDLIKSIFERNSFATYEINSLLELKIYGFVANPTNDNKKEFYLVVTIDDLERFVKKDGEDYIEYSHLYDLLSKFEFYTKDYNKNTSLIILHEFEKPDTTEEQKSMVFQVEENPYFFKKYIIHYTSVQLENLKSELGNNDKVLGELLNEIDFEEFKRNPFNDNFEPLVLRLYIKLPFLKAPHKAKDLDNLQETIDESLDQPNRELKEGILKISSIEDIDIFSFFEIPKKPKNE